MHIDSRKAIEYKNISMAVRSARLAVLIPKDDIHWKSVLLRAFEWFSKAWGGGYFIIVPTDGKTIDDVFWKILKDYDPDYIYSFKPSFLDLEYSNSPEFVQNYDENVKKFKSNFPDMSDDDIQNRIRSGFSLIERMEFKIEKELQEKIKQEIAPFYFENNIVDPIIISDSSIGYPLTSIETIINYGLVEKIWVLDPIRNIDCALVVHSNWGIYNKPYCEKLEKLGVQVNQIPNTIAFYDLFEMAIQNKVSDGHIQIKKSFAGLQGSDRWYPEEDITKFTPFKTSLLHLQKYLVNHDPEFYNEPNILVFGETIQDFCLYYCLSRYNQGIYWLPKLINSEEDGGITDDYKALAYAVVFALDDTSHNQPQTKIIITSLSKTEQELREVKEKLPKLFYASTELLNKRLSISLEPNLIKKTPLRVLEENNYMDHYTEAFENNRSIGALRTPKPKNFGKVVPYDHRWITEINIDGYVPPRLHFLGKLVANLFNISTESRVAKTGICYKCPNIGYFGGDIDVTLVRPHINIIEPLDIFQELFKEAGYEEVRVSDKGGFANVTIEKFGSLNDVSDFFKNEKNIKMFELFLQKKSQINPMQGEIIFANGRTYLDFSSINKFVGSETDTVNLIDLLIEREIFYRGTVLQCERCKATDWFSLGEIDQFFICKRCGFKQFIQLRNWKQGKEPNWYYKLDEAVYQGVNNNTKVPLLTLSYFQKKSIKSFLFTNELELKRNATDDKCEREIDICCIQDGLMILGECKKTKITKEAIDLLIKLSKELLRSPDMLIYSSLENDLSQEIIDYASKKTKIPIQFLKRADLVSI